MAKTYITKNQICQFCHIKFDSDNKKKFCSKKCYGNFQKGKPCIINLLNKRGKKPKTKKICFCLICKKPFERSYYRRFSKYCSKKCWSQRNPPIVMKCQYCNNNFTDYISNERKFCSKRCTDNHRKCHPEIYTPLILKGKYNSNKVFKNTYIEVIIQNLLKENNINFIPSYIFHGKFEIDIFIPDRKVAVECDGDYWHSFPKQKIQDKKKDKYLKTCGLKVVRLKEKTIVNNQYYCLKKIKSAISQQERLAYVK